MNESAVTVKTDLLSEILMTLKQKGVTSLREKLLLSLPDSVFKEGSTLWWEQQNLKGLEDYKSGRYTSYNSIDDYIKDLKKRI